MVGNNVAEIAPSSKRAKEIQEYANLMGIDALKRQVNWAQVPEWLRLELVNRELYDYTSSHTS